jgi:cephalosporin-C deacetylase-like acetyl esterase
MRINMTSSLGYRACALFCGALLGGRSALSADDARRKLILHLNSMAAAHLEERARDLTRIQTRADAEGRSRLVRARILAMIGNLPETRSALNAKSAGAALERDGFRIEKVIFESLPAFYVTANVYVPASGTGPFPAVVMTPGHSPTGKAGEYQLAANLARNGIAALAYDPMSEGERLQYFDAVTGKSAVGGPTGEHSQAALADDLTGEHISRYFVWDAMRAIDYLIARKDIDGGRIGAFGCSGGGTVTAYLTALDARVKAAATACYITAFQDLLAAPTGVQEAEQTIPGFIADGFDFADWVELAAPRPYAIVSTTNDMFPFEGARKSYEEARRIYALYGAADKLQWITGPGGHGALTPVHPEILAFFARALKNSGATPSYTRLTPDKPADLSCTPTGQVATSLGGETIASIIRKVRRARSGVDFRGPAGITAKPGTAPAAVTLEPEFTLHSEEGVDLPGRWIAPPSAGKRPAVVVLSGEVPEGLAGPDRVVLALAPRPSPAGSEAAKSPLQGSSYLLSLRAELVGRTLLGMRVDDIIRAIDWLAARPEVDPASITVYGKGGMGVALLHAAALDGRITRVVVEDTPGSYRAILDEPLHRDAPEIVVPGVLRHYDIADLIKAIAPRSVTVLEHLEGGALFTASHEVGLSEVGRSLRGMARASRRMGSDAATPPGTPRSFEELCRRRTAGRSSA